MKNILRCNALDSNGKQCRKLSALTLDYFGDVEMYHRYDKNVCWVRVNFCLEHFLGTRGKFIIKNKK